MPPDNKPQGDVMAEDAPASRPEPAQDDQQQTVELPLAAFKTPPKEGETIQLKVVSIDSNSAVINAVPVAAAPESGGSDSMAAEFDNQTK